MTKKVSLEAIKALRDKTGASINDCRKALETTGGDVEQARAWLREHIGASVAEKRQGNVASQGRIETYVHHDGRLGAIVEINCETDFVARTPEFVQFCRDVAMQVAAMSPKYVKPEEAPAGQNGPEALKADCLLEQSFVKDQKLAVKDLLKGLLATTKENVIIRRFTRFGVGDSA